MAAFEQSGAGRKRGGGGGCGGWGGGGRGSLAGLVGAAEKHERQSYTDGSSSHKQYQIRMRVVSNQRPRKACALMLKPCSCCSMHFALVSAHKAYAACMSERTFVCSSLRDRDDAFV